MKIYPKPSELRDAIRKGIYTGPTSGQSEAFVQANLVVLPRDWADDFALYGKLNSQAVPILEQGLPGDYLTHFLADKADIRTDIPLYRLYENGEWTDEMNNLIDIWQDDFVYFLIGCSFSFEEPLKNVGLEIRHQTEGRNVPMYITNIPTKAAGKFQSSPVVVSMRPFSPENAQLAAEITGRYPWVHGAPLHIGDPSLIGIKDIDEPDFGESVTIRSNEVPVFWACGVTPQMAAIVSRPPLMITHAPGHMFIGDILNSELNEILGE